MWSTARKEEVLRTHGYTGYQTASLGNLFGLPYVVMRKPEPIDTTTLNYNWQVWNTNAFSVYTKETDACKQEPMPLFYACTSCLRNRCHARRNIVPSQKMQLKANSP